MKHGKKLKRQCSMLGVLMLSMPGEWTSFSHNRRMVSTALVVLEQPLLTHLIPYT
ncbi:Mannosyl-oligosaccharide 12-alpha-mannosidase MNS1 [Zea mays]|uniref:Mannosyl-oligosaccharide 12-alpha-mannosidase MNS1 n=1 Tax=Zea mays TaxID=4577 RepID=A0A1D6J714_MAIZE|nr:Mannosyl-oligosaccharide 12-alpha-mannosidase MNS1 [Zea mays]